MKKLGNAINLAALVLVLFINAPASASEKDARVETVPGGIERIKQMVQDAGTAFENVTTYSAVLVIKERVNGKRRDPEKIFTYFSKPNSVYLRWLKGSPYQGLQTSYIETRDGPDNFLARETGFSGLMGTAKWGHYSKIVTTMYPHNFQTYETSIAHMLKLQNRIMTKALKLGKMDVTEVSEVIDPFLNRKAVKICMKMSDDPADGLLWLKGEFFADMETKFALHFRLYDFDGELSGEYAFTEFKPNVQVPDGIFELPKLKD
jgi:hypothetical protein